MARSTIWEKLCRWWSWTQERSLPREIDGPRSKKNVENNKWRRKRRTRGKYILSARKNEVLGVILRWYDGLVIWPGRSTTRSVRSVEDYFEQSKVNPKHHLNTHLFLVRYSSSGPPNLSIITLPLRQGCRSWEERGGLLLHLDRPVRTRCDFRALYRIHKVPAVPSTRHLKLSSQIRNRSFIFQAYLFCSVSAYPRCEQLDTASSPYSLQAPSPIYILASFGRLLSPILPSPPGPLPLQLTWLALFHDWRLFIDSLSCVEWLFCTVQLFLARWRSPSANGFDICVVSNRPPIWRPTVFTAPLGAV